MKMKQMHYKTCFIFFALEFEISLSKTSIKMSGLKALQVIAVEYCYMTNNYKEQLKFKMIVLALKIVD